MTTLKPCPFCPDGGKPEHLHNLSGRVCVRCAECLAEGPERDTPEEADAAWNRRAGDEAADSDGWTRKTGRWYRWFGDNFAVVYPHRETRGMWTWRIVDGPSGDAVGIDEAKEYAKAAAEAATRGTG